VNYSLFKITGKKAGLLIKPACQGFLIKPQVFPNPVKIIN
jgi:hypothetical protein